MALLPLVHFAELDDFYGGPFTAETVAVASATVRAAARWHIAPEVTETLTVDGAGGTRLLLPTLKLVDVTEVRQVAADGTTTVLEDWRLSAAGVLYRGCGWPRGFQVLEVDVVHGYDECPPELLPVIAAACRAQASDPRLASIGRGPFSESYRDTTLGDDPSLARHTLPPRP